jgi:hypothetical protein
LYLSRVDPATANGVRTIKPEKRVSADGRNFYYMLMDSTEWVGWPVRNRSIIVGNKYDTSRFTHMTNVIFPVGDPDFAVTQLKDFWTQRPVNGDYLSGVNWYVSGNRSSTIHIEGALSDVLQSYGMKLNFEMHDKEELRDILRQLTATALTTTPKSQYVRFDHDTLTLMRNDPDYLLNALQQNFSPENMAATKKKMSEMTQEDTDNESWFSSNAISVPMDTVNRILESLNKPTLK